MQIRARFFICFNCGVSFIFIAFMVWNMVIDGRVYV